MNGVLVNVHCDRTRKRRINAQSMSKRRHKESSLHTAKREKGCHTVSGRKVSVSHTTWIMSLVPIDAT
jgi:hypothetical protein